MAYNPITLGGPFTLGQVVPITFDLEKPEDLYITVDGVVVSSSTYTWNTSTSIQLGGTFPLSGLSASFARRSDSSDLPGLLVGGAALDYDLINANDTRLLMLAQEVRNNADSAVSTVLDAQDDVTVKYTEIATKHGDVVVKHADVVTKHSDVVTKSADVTSKYNQVNTWQGQVASNKAAAEAAKLAAQAAASSALSAFDNFDDRFLGAKASDPSTDNDGNPLTDGILYYNATSGVMKVYGGGLWRSAYVSADGVVLLANNLGDIPDKALARSNLGANNANNLTNGTVPDAVIAAKYKASLAYLGDINPNTLVTPGWSGTIGPSHANLPKLGYFNIEVSGAAGAYITQVAWPYADNISGNGLWLRGSANGGTVWGAWQQIYYASQQDARYARLGATNIFTEDQNIGKANPALSLSKAASGQYNSIQGYTAGSLRWFLALGDNVAESGANAGSDFTIYRYSDAAAYLGISFNISRQTGAVSIEGGNRVHHDGNAARFGAPDAVLEDQKASGTASQSFTAATWTTRDLNTEVRDPYGLITISSNQFTPTMDGWVEWETVLLDAGGSRLWNVTDGVLVKQGTSVSVASGYNISKTTGGGAVVAGKTYRIEFRQSTANPVLATSIGTEVYTRVLFWRR